METLYYSTVRNIKYPIGEFIQMNLPNINGMAKMIKSLKKTNIVLCCMGSSGAIIAALVASKLPQNSCRIAHIKKDGEFAHESNVEHLFDENPYVIIIDDFVVSGKTITKIYEGIKKYLLKEVDCLCVDSSHITIYPFKFKTLIKSE